MTALSEVLDAISVCLDRKLKLVECQAHPRGDVEYYCFGYIRDVETAEAALERALNHYIDQRVTEQLAKSALNNAMPGSMVQP